MKTMRKVLVLLAALAAATPLAAAEWHPNLYNPLPADDDVILPLPCGGAMAFRRVVTHQVANPDDPGSIFSDKAIELGRVSITGERIYIESRRPDFISGSIASDDGALSYLIGKYEVTQGQYSAVMAADTASCPASLSPADALPVVDVSWYDGVEFTRRVNNWIYGSDAAVTTMLISLGIVDGYVRLPTETEWEFAARGGLSVPDSERANLTFPMPEGLAAYAWYNAPQSANGKLRPVGTRKPNPLGIYDIYGNAAEMVLEPFRMTRVTRMHGRIGGFVAKGGSFLDEPGVIGSALRNEYPYFSQAANGEMHTRSIGLRVVVGTAAIGQSADVAALEDAAMQALGEVSATSAQEPARPETAALKLALIAAETQDATMRAEIERLSSELAGEFDRRDALERKAINAALVNAALAGRELAITSRSLDAFFLMMRDMTANDPDLAAAQARFEGNQANFILFARRYTDAIQALANDYADRIDEQIAIVERELLEQGDDQLGTFLQLVRQQVADYASGGRTETGDIVRTVVGGDALWM